MSSKPPNPQSVLNQMAQIHRMERGTVHVLRQGPQGPYYNHQCYENGKNVSRYVPADQVSELQEAIAGYHRFQELVRQYVDLMVQQTRAERATGAKKRPHAPVPPSPRAGDSSVNGPLQRPRAQWDRR